MRVAIAIMSNATKLYAGPYGHAPFFAIYDLKDDGWRRVELRDNPYKALEGGGKPRLLGQLLADCDLWVGVRFGHEEGGHHHHHQGPRHHEHGSPPEHVRKVDKDLSIEEALALIAAS